MVQVQTHLVPVIRHTIHWLHVAPALDGSRTVVAPIALVGRVVAPVVVGDGRWSKDFLQFEQCLMFYKFNVYSST